MSNKFDALGAAASARSPSRSTGGRRNELAAVDDVDDDPTAYTDDPVSTSLARLVRDLGPGAQLPRERNLAAQLKVSRTALRNRIQLLEGIGVLRRTAGSGTYVEALQPSELALALDVAITASHLPADSLHIVRIALERDAAAEAACTRDQSLVVYMRKAVDIISSVPNDHVVNEADFHFYDTLPRALGNPTLSFFADPLPGVRRQALRRRRLEMRRLAADHEVMVELHQSVYETVLSGDPSRRWRPATTTSNDLNNSHRLATSPRGGTNLGDDGDPVPPAHHPILHQLRRRSKCVS